MFTWSARPLGVGASSLSCGAAQVAIHLSKNVLSLLQQRAQRVQGLKYGGIRSQILHP